MTNLTNLTNTREQPASQKASHSLLISFSPPRPKAKKQRPPRSDCDCTCALFDRTMLPLSLAEWGINTVVVVVVTLIIIWRPSGMCSVHRLFQLNEMSPKKHCDMGQNSAFFRGTLEKMPAEGLQNCPRAGGPRAVLEARGRHLFKSPEEKGGILTLLTGLYHFSLSERCFSEQRE